MERGKGKLSKRTDPCQNSKTTITTPASPVLEAGRVFALGDDEFGQCAGSGSDSPSLRSDLCGLKSLNIRLIEIKQSIKGGAAAIPLPSTQLAVGEGMEVSKLLNEIEFGARGCCWCMPLLCLGCHRRGLQEFCTNCCNELFSSEI